MGNESDDLLIANAMRAWTKARFGERIGDVATPLLVTSPTETLLVPARLTLSVAHWSRGGQRIWTAPRESPPNRLRANRRSP
jgi:hypothetical protein